MGSSLEALLRGSGQGATLGWGDEASSKILDLLPGPKDPEGLSREYAAGSPQEDYLQNFRADNSSAASEYPNTYASGALLGSVPTSVAATQLAPAAGLAGGALTGAALGGMSGAGASDENKLTGALGGAAAGGLLGFGGAALAEGLPALQSIAREGLGPQLASAEAGAAGGAGINQSRAMHPPARTSGVWEMPSIPKAGKTPISESLIPASDDLAEAADVVHGQKMLGRGMNEKDVEKFVGLRDKVKAGSKRSEPQAEPKQDLYPEEEKSGVVKTVRPPRGGIKKTKAAVALQQELPGVDINQRSQADFANAKQRFADANSLLKSSPEETAALKSWVHESRSGASPELEALQGRAGNYGVGYRGLKLSPEQLNKALQSGEIPHDDMSSWSVNPETAKSFGPVLLRQTETTGIPVGRNEGEVLVPPQGSMRITRVSQSPDGFLNMDVQRALKDMPETKPNLTDEEQLKLF